LRNEYFNFKTLTDIRQRVESLGLSDAIGFDEHVTPASGSRLSQPVQFGPFKLNNPIACHPMEGWDGDPLTGAPTEDVFRRWQRMGEGGFGLIWGIEALAVDMEYRANSHQVVLTGKTAAGVEEGLRRMRQSHAAAFGPSSKLVVGAQLTCSGRYSYGRPEGSPLLLVYHHPELDRRLKADESTPLMSDMKMEDVVGQYAKAARLAKSVGFDFIDIKACHRYWLNETLAAKTRPGQYGGSFENRTKIFLMIVDAVRREVGPDFPLGSRLNAYDGIPFEEDTDTRTPGLKGKGRPSAYTTPYRWSWGAHESEPLETDHTEPLRLIGLLKEKGLRMINLSAASPYSNPHLSRPTETPPVDGYQPFHDPLHEVAMHFRFARAFKQAHPDVFFVGTGYSYLRQFKAQAMEHNLRSGSVDLVGLGRAVLAYHDEARNLAEKGEAKPSKGRIVCTGDSACTTGPRMGLKSGCIFDPYYKDVNAEIARKLSEMGLGKK
jgi:2,4-dienoyl-CoA reductase-like NADH-dependent reductase (Old Yellow Enzyme family)